MTPRAGTCAGCGRAVQECRHLPKCTLWVDAEGSAFCTDGRTIHDPLTRHQTGDSSCCCYPGACAGHVVDAAPAFTRHPWGIPCNEPSFHGNEV